MATVNTSANPRIEAERLARLRLLLSDTISLDRAWHELNERGAHTAPQVVVEAVLHQLRTDGLGVFADPNCRRRLTDLSDGQLRDVLAVLIRVRTRCPAVTDELLIALDEIRR
jgi:hypothetical protein